MEKKQTAQSEISAVVTRWHRYRVTLTFADGREEQRFFSGPELANAYGCGCVTAYGSDLVRWTVALAKLEPERRGPSVADMVRQRDAFRRAGYEWPSGRKIAR